MIYMTRYIQKTFLEEINIKHQEAIVNNKDLVSIITPAYNCEKYISETIESVLEQTYANWEMLIIDDGSTDNTINIIKSYNDDRIRVIQNQANIGAALSRNRGLKEARGKWIAFLDSDDLWYPKKLEGQIAFMVQNNYGFTYTEYIEMDEKLGRETVKISGPKHISKRSMYAYDWVGCLTVMYDSEVVGVLEIPDLKKRNDYALWLKAIHYSDCYLYPHVLAKYRKRPDSISSAPKMVLMYHQYVLYRKSENKTKVMSVLFTIRNACWSIFKKLFYHKKVEKRM